jgi:hypothetical protein
MTDSKFNLKMTFFLNRFLPNKDDNIEVDLESGNNNTLYPDLLPTHPTPRIETSGDSMQLSPDEFGGGSNPNLKRSQHWNQANSAIAFAKVRVVEQASRIPTVVCVVTCHVK